MRRSTVVRDRVVVPRALPQLVEHVEVLVGELVAAVVRDLAVEAEVACGVRQVARDDVPAEPPLREVVEGRRASSERERRLVGRGERHAETQPLRHRSHGRNQEQRIEVGALQPLAQGRLGPVAEDVVGPDDVGQEDGVESAVLEDLGELGPVGELVESVPVVARERPEAVRDVADARHLEQVQDERLRFGHADSPASVSATSAPSGVTA